MEDASARRGLTGNLLKWIAIVCMLIDHLAWTFIPFDSPLGMAMHLIGRVTGPTMCFFIAEGYFRTRNVRKYALRLLVFAVLSWPCFSLFESGKLFTPELGMIWTLFWSLLALCACDRLQNPVLKILSVFACCAFSILGDWPIFGVLYVLALGLNHPLRGGSFRKQVLWFSVVTVLMAMLEPVAALIAFPGQLTDALLVALLNLGVLLALPLLWRYNGQRGGKPWMKWAFYIFYPLHLLVLAVIDLVL